MPNKVDQYYNAISNGYDALHREEQQEKMIYIKKLLENDDDFELGNKDILLDIGCGTGISTSGFHFLSVGLDPAINLLKTANDARLIMKSDSDVTRQDASDRALSIDHLGYILGIAEALPIRTKSCSVVISVTAVHNFHDIKKGLSEINRITKDRAVITVLKRAKIFKEILEMIKQKFQVLKSVENPFDLILYLAPKN